MSDDELLAKLRGLGLPADREALGTLCEHALSAEDVARELLDGLSKKDLGFEEDWVWICLVTLWERWWPDKPCMEFLDDKMQRVAERWPTDADVREIARQAAASSEGIELRGEDAYAFLSRAALGGKHLDQMFESVKDVAGVPLWTISALLLGFRPRDKHWWESLDTTWNAFNAAEHTDIVDTASAAHPAEAHPEPPRSGEGTPP